MDFLRTEHGLFTEGAWAFKPMEQAQAFRRL